MADSTGFSPRENGHTGKPQLNESEGTKYFVLYRRGFVIKGFFTIRITTEGLQFKFFIARILLLKGLLYRGFSVMVNAWVLKQSIVNILQTRKGGVPFYPSCPI